MRTNDKILERQIHQTIRDVDPRLPVVTATSLVQYYHDNPFVWLATIGARLAVGSGVMALFLASLGIYAVKGYMVASRTPEIGIRKALGATGRDVLAMVLRDGLVSTVIGLVLGLLLGLGVACLIASLLYGVEPLDPVSIAVTIVLLAAASVLAGYLPARRAMKIDPMDALRYE
jgi:ABC-type antimicrobial peptide transport system permease subunit